MCTSMAKAYNGVTLISREPLEDVRCGFVGELPDDASERARRTEARDQRTAEWRSRAQPFPCRMDQA